ncbi:LLM class flavin-dependent oxidoreductase [Herbidospora daliensis]|uniref:LLM class flavin-dependent oxidoreductase n=1 Tax=Herbidospora daliensis TaxID=295585 RepID=UPI000781C682|nr:LLM class flavin-dependent oxidoreductase [Herbidospora daliensis]
MNDAIRGTARGTAPVPLSVLDLVPVGTGTTPAQALRSSIELSRIADRRGYHRHWIAEHHSAPSVASSSPAVILAHLAAHTQRVRLGSGGVMLPNHPPLIIAEQFGVLEALAPGRVDLGLGRAPGTDPATAAALRRSDQGGGDFPQQLSDLLRFLDDDFPAGHPYARVHAVPGPVQGATSRPPVWLLGSSGFSARLAGTLGLPFAFAHHFSADNTVAALDLYRQSFRPSTLLDAPYVLISVNTMAADTEREAHRQVMAGALAMIQLHAGRLGLLPSPEEAEAYDFTSAEWKFAQNWIADIVHGTPDAVRNGLNALQQRTGADELMLTTLMSHSNDARLRTYELIADAYGFPQD